MQHSLFQGSYEALSKKSGFLQKDDYFKLGRKRAPNFSDMRGTIYELYLKYRAFKQKYSCYDETDVVHSVFHRLRNLETRHWVIHQIYVDETQDFTQAELCLLLRLCQSPNDMFLTGIAIV